MKVKELIEKLKEFDGDLEVKMGYLNMSNNFMSPDTEEEDSIHSIELDYDEVILLNLMRTKDET